MPFKLMSPPQTTAEAINIDNLRVSHHSARFCSFGDYKFGVYIATIMQMEIAFIVCAETVMRRDSLTNKHAQRQFDRQFNINQLFKKSFFSYN